MGSEEGFLAAIAAEPTDDGLRLIYADWLEERGDPRHELVRVCQAMRTVPVWSDRYWELRARRNELWEQFPLAWLEATGYDGSYYDPVFRDGVPDGCRERWRLIREFTESGEMLVLMGKPWNRYEGRLQRCMRVIVRRPIPIETIPGYLFGAGDQNTGGAGILAPERDRRQQEEEQRQPGAHRPPRWVSVLRRHETARLQEAEPPPPQNVPWSEVDDDISF